jgi:hypothetical protein
LRAAGDHDDLTPQAALPKPPLPGAWRQSRVSVWESQTGECGRGSGDGGSPIVTRGRKDFLAFAKESLAFGKEFLGFSKDFFGGFVGFQGLAREKRKKTTSANFLIRRGRETRGIFLTF